MRARLGLIVAIAGVAWAQEDEATRQIWNSLYYSSRPKPATARPKPAAKPQYRPATPQSGAGTPGTPAVNVTVWKCERSRAGDGARLFVLEGDIKQAYTPRRLEPGERLRDGEHMRLSIEAPRGGYLYVVDQELDASGKAGIPYLLFPTRSTRGGDNRLQPGQVVEVPAQTDPIPWFTLRRKGTTGGELLSIVVTDSPISGVVPAEREQPLSPELFAAWVKQWGNSAQRFDLVGGKDQPWTEAEQEAGRNRDRKLTLEDAPPQSMFVVRDLGRGGVLVPMRMEVN